MIVLPERADTIVPLEAISDRGARLRERGQQSKD
jgi:hypothetical protein